MHKQVGMIFFFVSVFISHNAISDEYQPLRKSRSRPTRRKEPNFYAPIKFSSSGIRCFLRHNFSHPNYATEFLPFNFWHLQKFLLHGKRSGQQRTFAKSVIRLFANKLKASPYVNSYAWSELLHELPELLKGHFQPFSSQDVTHMKGQITDLLYSSFLTSFNDFKANPSFFFETLSDDIINKISFQENIIEDASIEDLRKTLMVFLETGINKLIWAPEDKQDTWKMVKLISQQLARLMNDHIITDPNDLNDLFISLLERYCFILDISAGKLPLEFFQFVRHDINNNKIVLLELEEQEKFIETKKQRFTRALIQAEAKARASEYGILA